MLRLNISANWTWAATLTLMFMLLKKEMDFAAYSCCRTYLPPVDELIGEVSPVLVHEVPQLPLFEPPFTPSMKSLVRGTSFEKIGISTV